jgi:hypothetical protein
MSIFGLFGKKTTLYPQAIYKADGNFLASYLKIGEDYEFDIKKNIWDIAVSTFVQFLQKPTLNVI